MTNNLHTRAAVITAGLMLLGGAAAAPALAYPVGASLTIACDATSYAPGATATCTLTNVNPAGPNDIVLGGKIAAGETVSFSLASVAAAAPTYSEQLVLPTTAGTYEVIGTSAGETAKTNVIVVATGGTAGTAAPNAATTPKTGADVGLMVAAGLVALGVGGGLFVASRRKQA